MNEFVHLHCHSAYSFLEGASLPEDLLEAAGRGGMRSLALTDTNGLYGAVRFYRRAKASGIRPILGADLHTEEGSLRLLARDLDGYRGICRLLTRFHLGEGFDLLQALPERGVFLLSSSSSLLGRIVRHRGSRDLYTEVPPKGRIVRNLLELSRTLALPPVAAQEVLFSRPSLFETARLLSAIRERTAIDALPAPRIPSPRAWLMPAAEMARLFSFLPEGVKNALEIADACRLELPLGEWLIPSPTPLRRREAGRKLRVLCEEGLRKRRLPHVPRVRGRLTYELAVIERLGFCPYFLTVHEIVREARGRGIPSLGRGSAAGSLVSYLLGITHVDPIRYNLHFERFLNPGRSTPPDIDLDFPWNRRDEILSFIFRRFGKEKAAMISTHVTFHLRGALRETGRAMGLPEEEISRFTRNLPYGADPRDLAEGLRSIPECGDLPVGEEPWRSLLRLAGGLLGLPRHMGIHAGGVVISPTPLTERTALERSAKGIPLTQVEMRDAEALGLVKIDILGQRSLAVLEDTIRAVRKNRRAAPPVENTERLFRDPETVRLIREGRTMGCFYIESPAMRSLLRKLGVETFDDLTAASSVIRPGVARSGMMSLYIARHRGREKTPPPHPLLREVLRETHGVMIYQEDVLRVARAAAGLSLAEADLLRRAMSGKMRSERAMHALRDRFLRGALKKGLRGEDAAEVWRQMKSFAGYAFCKAHSASFALLSFQVAYLKAHHTAEFLAAVISNGGGFYTASAYLEEARRLGIRILPPDVNRSGFAYTGGEGGIRVGLMQVKNLSEKSLRCLLRERDRNGPYRSLPDLLSRVPIGRSEAENLVFCGAFDSLGGGSESRPRLLWELRRAGKRERGLFPEPPLPLPDLTPYGRERVLSLERERLGLAVSAHPLHLFLPRIREDGFLPAEALERHPGERVRLLGWIVCMKKVFTAKGEGMRFLTMEDLTATFEATLFPRVYRRCGHLLTRRGPYVLEGKVEEEEGACSLTVDTLRLPKGIA